MKLQIVVEAYRRRLAAPLATSSGVITERAGFLVRLRDAEGREGCGEAAPVYWIDDDPLEAVGDFLRALAGRAIDVDALDLRDVHDVRASLDAVSAVVARVAIAAGGEPRLAALAAIETAALDLTARRRGIAVATLLGGSADSCVAVNALVATAAPQQVARAVRRHVANGVRAIKLKVGASNPTIDADRVRAAVHALPRGVRLRLDANRAWSFETAKAVLAAAAPDAIDYVEEPLAVPTAAELARLRRATGVAVAVDESLSVLGGIAVLTASEACDVVVLKPARIGGPLTALALAREAHEHSLRCVLTDSIETAVGRAAVVHTAAALGGEPDAVGLGGRGLLDDEPIHPSLRPCGPGLAICSEARP